MSLEAPLRIGMVAGEPSGDLLAARVLHGLRASDPALVCEGIGGPHMAAQGLTLRHPMHALTVFGYVDALKRLPSLLRIYGDVRRHWQRQRPDVFVGVDAPDFNLRLERQLRQAGVPTVHFVSPSIWAWRFERIHIIRQAVAHMLVLFPFEEAIYRNAGVPVTYVGHPLASLIPMQPDQDAARRALGLDVDARVLAVLPGSRASEIDWLAPRFLQAIQRLQQQDPDLVVVAPMVNGARQAQFARFLAQYPVKNLRVVAQASYDPQALAARANAHAVQVAQGLADASHDAGFPQARPVAWDALQAANAVLVASGTATLEAALFKKPMVISYVLSPWMRRLMAFKSGQTRPTLPWVGLPNILAGESVVPELLQDAATPQALAEAAWTALTDADHRQAVRQRFEALHTALHRDTPALAAQAIVQVAQGG